MMEMFRNVSNTFGIVWAFHLAVFVCIGMQRICIPRAQRDTIFLLAHSSARKCVGSRLLSPVTNIVHCVCHTNTSLPSVLAEKTYKAIRHYRHEPSYAAIMMMHPYNALCTAKVDTEVVIWGHFTGFWSGYYITKKYSSRISKGMF